MEKIKSIEVDKWSEPDENHRVKHLGMITRGEAFEQLKAHLESEFGSIEIVKSEGVEGEFGFITGKISENEYEEHAKEFPAILSRIRMEG